MKKIEKIKKQMNDILKNSVILKDSSYRRPGGYFGTSKPSFDKELLLKIESRTQYLNTYYLAKDANTASSYNSLKKYVADFELKLDKKRTREIEKRNKAIESASLYSIEDGFVILSDKERQKKYFDVEKLARTLNIRIEDAILLKSEGKTYVFAKTTDGDIIELYHPSLDCNYLSIHVTFNAGEEFKKFTEEREDWVSAPYAHLVGQSDNKNHFVC